MSLVSRYGSSMDPGVLLLLMVLFLFYDGMSGNPATSMKHLTAAVRIYESLKFSQTSQTVNEVVKPMLHQLRNTAVILGTDIFPGPPRELIKTSKISIRSFKDADREIETLTKITSDLTWLYPSMTPADQDEHLSQLRKQVEKWKHAYTVYADKKLGCDLSHAQIAATYLDIRSHLLDVRLASEPFVPGKTLEGTHLKELQRIVALCQCLFVSLDAGLWTPAAISKKLGIHTDLTLILSYMLMHCHHPAVRMPVLRLLKIWCREYGSSSDAASLPDLDVLIDVMSVLYGLSGDGIDGILHPNLRDEHPTKNIPLCPTLASLSADAQQVSAVSERAMLQSQQA
jgi:hypothetical protein